MEDLHKKDHDELGTHRYNEFNSRRAENSEEAVVTSVERLSPFDRALLTYALP